MCDKLSTAFSVTLGPRLLMPCFMQLFLCKVCSLNGMLVPFFYNCWLQFGSIQLAHCFCDTTGKQKHRLPLHRYGGGSQVSELSSFSP